MPTSLGREWNERMAPCVHEAGDAVVGHRFVARVIGASVQGDASGHALVGKTRELLARLTSWLFGGASRVPTGAWVSEASRAAPVSAGIGGWESHRAHKDPGS